MIPDLPSPLRAALDALLEGVSRTDLAARAGKVFDQYRKGGGSGPVIGGADDALAYALSRLPATYAADLAAFSEAQRLAPDFAPRSLLDAGAGPGGASWAALEAWPSLAAVTLLDASAPFLELAGRLAAQGPQALVEADRRRGDMTAPKDWPAADLVVTSYALAEIAVARQAQVVEALWASTQAMLVIVEPGTPAGFERLRAARRQLIDAGATILAPCPHQLACPMAGDDWCHFVQRLPRSRDHRLTKGADAPYEDEKYAYVVAARPGLAEAPHAPRILAPPKTAKPGIDLKLCTPAGTVEPRFAPRRDKPTYAKARRLDWGDVWEG